MTEQDRQEIKDWLTSGADFATGARLYAKHGHNLVLRRRLMFGDNPTTKGILVAELSRIANVKAPMRDVVIQQRATKTNAPDEETRRRLKLREQYPFLNRPDCPDCLKIVVADMLTSHVIYVDGHKRLSLMSDDDPDAADVCKSIVEAYLTNRLCNAELENYKKTGALLGVTKPVEDWLAKDKNAIDGLTDLQLKQKFDSARAQVSKQRSKGNAELLAKWERTRDMLGAALAARKKKQ